MEKTVKKRRRWTLLLVADNGRTVPIPYPRVWLVFMGLAVAAALVTAAAAVVVQGQARDQSRRLRAELDEIQGQMENLNQEKDLLMASLAATRVQLKAASRKGSEPEARAIPAAPAQNQAAAPAPASAPASASALASAPTQASDTGHGEEPRVAVEDFRVDGDPETGGLRVQFKLTNIQGEEAPISGYTFVVLKDPSAPESDWQVLPRVPLHQGKPAVPTRGRSYAIARFNTIRFPAGAVHELSGVRQATVLVYDGDGLLLLKKDFPVDLSSD